MIQLSDGFFMNVDSRNYTIGIPKKQIVENKETGEPQETIIMTDAKYYPTLNAALVGWWEAVRTKKLSEFNGSLEEALRLVKEQDKEIRSLIDNFNITIIYYETPMLDNIVIAQEIEANYLLKKITGLNGLYRQGRLFFYLYLSVFHVVRQRVKAVAYVYVFANHIFRQIKVNCGEVPDSLDSRIADGVRNDLGFFRGNRNHGNVYVFVFNKAGKVAAGHNLRVLKLHILNNLLNVKYSGNMEAALVVGNIAGHGLTQSAVAYDYNLILSVQSQDRADFVI